MPKVGEEGSLPWADGDLNVQAEMTDVVVSINFIQSQEKFARHVNYLFG